ncbi:MAG: response regulator transcription factor [Halobacteriovoraceae bacterium]|nr:response regulator transcription factor [Halobacteriovoraceae bacterium]
MKNLLLVEDDPILGKAIFTALELEGNNIIWAINLEQGRGYLSQKTFDLALLDVGLPDGNGIDFCGEVKEKFPHLPIIMLTAVVDEDSVVKALEIGANDYIRKPFGNKELIARINATLKVTDTNPTQVEYQGLKVDLEKRKVFYRGEEISFPRRQIDVLYFIMANSEKVITRESLINYLDKDSEIVDRTIDSHISQIRKNLKKCNISSIELNSVYGVGYRLEKAA